MSENDLINTKFSSLIEKKVGLSINEIMECSSDEIQHHIEKNVGQGRIIETEYMPALANVQVYSKDKSKKRSKENWKFAIIGALLGYLFSYLSGWLFHI